LRADVPPYRDEGSANGTGRESVMYRHYTPAITTPFFER
jgi:hypothetical protein